jgi:hypothetical protein
LQSCLASVSVIDESTLLSGTLVAGVPALPERPPGPLLLLLEQAAARSMKDDKTRDDERDKRMREASS